MTKSEPGKVSRRGAAVDREADVGELVGDALRGPLVFARPGLDLLANSGQGGVWS
ncbi:hypothetical protein [Actinomadura sp. 21ATH]|uniref:hypothetical protein n=1 Tax=Actinomadura sp. 21ATH TaxID=1735444 RepID=UPI0035BF6348